MKSMTIMFYQSKTFLQRYIRHIQSSTPNLTICSLLIKNFSNIKSSGLPKNQARANQVWPD
ncbi:hypothetical protein BLOT_002531 [Blomia tropicalis]|nr:hypothetical protein BLOT_002531 [Blomia tropicalis]